MANDSQSNDIESRKQAALAKWEAEWEAMDFSWDGLADAGWDLGDEASKPQKLKRWRAPAHFPGDGQVHDRGKYSWKEATLQDYWRWSIGIIDDQPTRLLSDDELIEKGLLERDEDDKLQHAIHRAQASVSPALLQDALLARMKEAYEVRNTINFNNGEYIYKNYVNLTGSRYNKLANVLERISKAHHTEIGELFIRIDYSYIVNLLVYNIEKFKKLEFFNSIIKIEKYKTDIDYGKYDYTDFNLHLKDCHILHDILIGWSSVVNCIYITDTTLHGTLELSSLTNAINLSLQNIDIKGRVSFNECKFKTFIMQEDRNTVASDTYYRSLNDTVLFSNIEIINTMSLKKIYFKNNVEFINCRFGDDAIFEHLIFDGNVRFSYCTFGDNVSFLHTEFNNVEFNRCTFGENTSFLKTKFNKNVSFIDCQFGNSASFGDACFCGVAVFRSIAFGDRASFLAAQFHNQMDFGGTEFKGEVFFKGCTFPKDPVNNLNAFRATRFRELVSFDEVDIHCLAAFNEARFQNGVIFHDPGEMRTDELWEHALAALDNAAKEKEKSESAEEVGDHDKENLTEAYYTALEGGCRVLKHEMEKIADRSREQRYFRYELIARRHRPDINLMEKWVSHIYGLTSDYGHSIGRPLLYMGGLFLVMMLCMFLIAVCGAGTLDIGLFAPPHPALVDSFALAWQNIVKPGAVWDVRFPLSVPALTAAFNGPGLPVWLKVLASVHSALSFICLFLAGVAIRRKFRIG